MSQTSDKSEAGDEIFYAMFHNVAPGVYQYKIRIGEDQWVIDESRETSKLAHDPQLIVPG